MPAWLIPALKAVLPHVGTIVSAAAPVFTRKVPHNDADQTVILQEQITELQTAASRNDAHIKELAEQIQTTVEAMQRGASLAEKKYQRILALSLAAMLLSLVSLGTALYLLA